MQTDIPIPDRTVLRIGHIASGLGGGAKGFKKAKGTYMLGDIPVEWEWENVAGADVNSTRNRQFERIVGAPAYDVDLFPRRDYIAYHSEFQDLADDSLIPILERLQKRNVHPDGLVTHEGKRYWKYDGAWAQVVTWSPPPPGWKEAGFEDLHRIFGTTPPDAFFHSLPCQGNSRLLPGSKAVTWKYKALNNLVPHAAYLCMLAWPDHPVPVLFGENVPGIKQRSALLLADMERTAKGLGYRTAMGDHDAGEIGGLAQSRRRFVWIQVHNETVPQFVYKPRKRGLKPIRAVLDDKPMPGDPAGGPMHALLNLNFITELRLALIRPGGDWKDIPGPDQWRLLTLDGREVSAEAFSKILTDKNGKVLHDKQGRPRIKWFAPDPNEWGRIFVAELLPGAEHYEDVRLQHVPMGNGKGTLWVQDKNTHSGVITADPSHRKSGGASTAAEDRLNIQCPEKSDRHASHLRVHGQDGPGGTATGADHVANGAPCTSEERLELRLPDRDNRYTDKFNVQDPDQESTTITTQTDVQTGAGLVAEERINLRLGERDNRHSTKYENLDPNHEADTVTTSDRLGSGAPSMTDIRVGLSSPKFEHAYDTNAFDETPSAVAGGTGPSSGGITAADPRLGFAARDNAHHVGDPNQTSPTIPGNAAVTSSNGPAAVADARFFGIRYDGSCQVMNPDQSAPPVIGATNVTTSNGPAAQADARLQRQAWGGVMPVADPDDPALTVTDHINPNGNAISAADTRILRNAKAGTSRVLSPDDHAGTVTPHTDVNGDAPAGSDPRFTCKTQNGTMGLVPWNGNAPTVIASLDVYAGQAATEDQRATLQQTGVVCTVEWTGPNPMTIASLTADGKVNIRNWPDWFPPFFIISPWNAWHRALTDWELAILQGFDAYDEDGRPFYLEGSRKDRRAGIGNAVPPPAAEGIGEAIAPTLIVARYAHDAYLLFSPTGEGVWVRDQLEAMVVAMFAKQFDLDPDSIRPDTLLQDLGGDNVDLWASRVCLEIKLGRSVTMDVWKPGVSVGDLVDWLERHAVNTQTSVDSISEASTSAGLDLPDQWPLAE